MAIVVLTKVIFGGLLLKGIYVPEALIDILSLEIGMTFVTETVFALVFGFDWWPAHTFLYALASALWVLLQPIVTWARERFCESYDCGDYDASFVG